MGKSNGMGERDSISRSIVASLIGLVIARTIFLPGDLLRRWREGVDSRL